MNDLDRSHHFKKSIKILMTSLLIHTPIRFYFKIRKLLNDMIIIQRFESLDKKNRKEPKLTDVSFDDFNDVGAFSRFSDDFFDTGFQDIVTFC